jgi:hypothetical protein
MLNVRALFLALLIALVISACGGGGDGSPSSGNQNGSPGNAAPRIQGQPDSSVLPSQSYSFQPSANDPDGDTLSFSVSNLPAWASFDSSTGRLSGTPTSADLGTYSGITITVSDGGASASLGPFAISVTDFGTGTATLSWEAPNQNSDGTALTDLAGFEVRYGRDENELSQSVALTNPSISTYMVENLTSGTWYFAVSAVNSSGVTSALSNVASKTIG